MEEAGGGLHGFLYEEELPRGPQGDFRYTGWEEPMLGTQCSTNVPPMSHILVPICISWERETPRTARITPMPPPSQLCCGHRPALVLSSCFT